MGRHQLQEKRSVGVAYILWVPSLFGCAGLHRFYTGRWFSGLAWFFTLGLCGIGTLIDLFRIPAHVRAFNRTLGSGEDGSTEQLLLTLARRRGAQGFTFNDAVLDLQLPSTVLRPEIERLVNQLMLEVGNDAEGRIIYREP